MKLVRVQALKDHEWKTIPRKEGEKYLVDSEDIRFHALITIGLAKLVDDPVVIAPEPQQPAPTGRYNRRDLRAKR